MSLITPKHFTLEEYLNGGSRSVISQNDRELLKKEFYELSIEEQQRNLSILFYLEPIRKEFGKPIYITCGYRSKRHELKKGRSGNSMHLIGAVDLTCDDIKGLNKKLSNHCGGYKYYKDSHFIHVDLGRNRRW